MKNLRAVICHRVQVELLKKLLVGQSQRPLAAEKLLTVESFPTLWSQGLRHSVQ